MLIIMLSQVCKYKKNPYLICTLVYSTTLLLKNGLITVETDFNQVVYLQ